MNGCALNFLVDFIDDFRFTLIDYNNAMEYSIAKGGKLKLKGEKSKKHKHKKSKKRKHDGGDDGESSSAKKAALEDTQAHGGWWVCRQIEDMSGAVCIEIGVKSYVSALDNGLFTVGAAREQGVGPSPEEILMALRVLDTDKISLKSGFDKYLAVGEKGKVVGRSDAIGPREQWEPIFEDGKMALLGCNGCFLGVDEEGDIVCNSKKAGAGEFVQIRSNASKEIDPLADVPVEEKGGKVYETEINYVKKFQSFQDRRLRINTEDKTDLKAARESGKFHEALLDRREKMKSDRMCK